MTETKEHPKCKCGATCGLHRWRDRWWCPECLEKRIEELETALAYTELIDPQEQPLARSMVAVTVCQKITHPTNPSVARIQVLLPAEPMIGDKLLLPGITARVAYRTMEAGQEDVIIWVENYNFAYKGLTTAIDEEEKKRIACGWTID